MNHLWIYVSPKVESLPLLARKEVRCSKSQKEIIKIVKSQIDSSFRAEKPNRFRGFVYKNSFMIFPHKLVPRQTWLRNGLQTVLFATVDKIKGRTVIKYRIGPQYIDYIFPAGLLIVWMMLVERWMSHAVPLTNLILGSAVFSLVALHYWISWAVDKNCVEEEGRSFLKELSQ